MLKRYAQSVEEAKGDKGRKDYAYAYEAYKSVREAMTGKVEKIFAGLNLEKIISQPKKRIEAVSKITKAMSDEEAAEMTEKAKGDGIDKILSYIKENVKVGILTRAGVGIEDEFLAVLGYGKKEIKQILKNYKAFLKSEEGLQSMGAKTLQDLSLTKEDKKQIAEEEKEKADNRRDALGKMDNANLKKEAAEKLNKEAQEKYKDIETAETKAANIKKYVEDNIDMAVNDLIKEYGGEEAETLYNDRNRTLIEAGLSAKLINLLTLNQILAKGWKEIESITEIYNKLNPSEKEKAGAIDKIDELKKYLKGKVTAAALLDGKKIDKNKLSLLGFSAEDIKDINRNYKEAKKINEEQANSEAVINFAVNEKKVEDSVKKLVAKKGKYITYNDIDIASLPLEKYKELVLKRLLDKEGVNVQANYEKLIKLSNDDNKKAYETFAGGLS
jgi:hypothetical protein